MPSAPSGRQRPYRFPGGQKIARKSGEMTPNKQAFLSFVVNVILLGAPMIILSTAYDKRPHVANPEYPVGFLAFQCGLLFLLILAYVDFWWFIAAKGREERCILPRRLQAWTDQRASPDLKGLKQVASMKSVIYFATILNFGAMWFLVDGTGGATESPFAALLAAPAVLGPALAMGRDGLSLLLVGGGMSVFFAGWHAPQHGQSSNLGAPEWCATAGASFVLVFNAVYISIIRLTPTGNITRVAKSVVCSPYTAICRYRGARRRRRPPSTGAEMSGSALVGQLHPGR